MAKAVIYTDFDGVINAFVQDKIALTVTLDEEPTIHEHQGHIGY